MKISQAEITIHNGSAVIDEVTQACAGGDHVLDFEAVSKVDSTVLLVILAAKRVLKSDKTLELVHPPAQLTSLISAYGVQSLFS